MAQGSDTHKRKSVLLVEPDDVIRQSLLNWLSSSIPECHVVGTASVKEALGLPRSEPPSVVVVDIADPDMDGEETIRNIRGTAGSAHIVALTMDEGAEYCEGLTRAGTTAHLPIWETQCQLLRTIRHLLAGKSRRQADDAAADYPDYSSGVI